MHVYLRSHADDLGRPSGSAGHVESLLFHGMPGIWLQHWTPDWSAIETLAVLVHGSWFLLLALPFIVCATAGSRAAAQLGAVMLALFYSADAWFAAFPTRPPWMDQQVSRIIIEVYGRSAASDGNAVASVPSLHVALPALYTLWLAYQPDRLLKRLAPILGAWTILIAWSVVYTGEHYMTGTMAGAGWALVIFGAALFAIPDLRLAWISRLRSARQARTAVSAAPTAVFADD
jgi:hypothetical protein